MERNTLGNRTFDEIGIGESASLERVFGRDDIDLFAAVSGDEGLAGLDAPLPAAGPFGHAVAHG